MSTLVQTICPTCSNRMRLKRPAQPTAAVRCPSCRNIFEVCSEELIEVPIVAELVEEAPMEAILMDDIFGGAPKQEDSTATVANIGHIEGASRPSSQSIEPPKPRNRAKAGKPLPDPTSNAYSVSSKPSKKLLLNGIVGVATLLLAVSGFFAVKFFWGSGKNGSMQLVGSYREALASSKEVLTKQSSQTDSATLDAEVDKVRSVLVECIRSPSFNETQLKELRTELNSLSDLTRDVKRSCTLLPLAASRGTKVEQLPQMIELIEKQLNYGLRRIVDNRERSTQFLMEAFELFRTIDRRLAESVTKLDAPDLESIAKTLDQLDEACIMYGEIALDRVEMTFEQKQIFESGEAFRRWALHQLSQAGHEKLCLALGKELDAEKSRFDQALRATRMDKLSLSGIERLKKRMSEPTGLLFQTADKNGSGSDLTSNTNSTDSIASNPVTNRRDGSRVTESSNPQSSNSTADTKPDESAGPKTSSVTASKGSPVFTNPFSGSAETQTVASSESGARPTTGSPGAATTQSSNGNNVSALQYDPNQAPVFPNAKYQSASSLSIKIVTKKSKAECEQIAATIGGKLNAAAVPDVQMRGNLVTISFSSFAGKPSDAIKHLGFGKVEICDSQSRTLYVNDFE